MKIDNWDRDIQYTSVCDWAGIKSKHYKKNYINGIEIKIITDPSHIVCGERGVFAEKEFKVGDIIGQYTGKIVTSDAFGKYVASLKTDDDLLGVDAENTGNEMRFINDYRNIKPEPNCQLSHTSVDGKPIVLVCVVKQINENDELLLNYGEGYWKSFAENIK
jgi:hypothetical protein